MLQEGGTVKIKYKKQMTYFGHFLQKFFVFQTESIPQGHLKIIKLHAKDAQSWQKALFNSICPLFLQFSILGCKQKHLKN